MQILAHSFELNEMKFNTEFAIANNTKYTTGWLEWIVEELGSAPSDRLRYCHFL